MNRVSRQRGVALITAILVVAIATIAATAMVSSGNIAIHRASTLQDTEMAWWYAEGVEQWVMTILERDREANEVDSLDEPWARPVDYLPVDEGVLRGRVVDLQGRFNLNNLGVQDTVAFERYRGHFERLFGAVEAGDGFQARAIAAAIRDWIDPDQEPTGFEGAEDNEYLGLAQPYRTANQPIATISELLLVKGMTPEIYRRLQPHITALPAMNTAINVNTAPAEVLLTLNEQPTPELEQFLKVRDTQPAGDLASVQTLFAAGGPAVRIDSQFFRLESEALIGSSRVGLYSLLYRPGTGGVVLLGRSTDAE